MNFGIVGCGLIGQKRAKALTPHRLVACADQVKERADALADLYPGCESTCDFQQVIRRDDVDAVIVATTNNMLASIAGAAAESGKHVLVEKPGGRREDDVQRLRDIEEATGVTVRVGFNHRYHPALQRAHAIFSEGGVGPLLYIRGRYGHGGRPNYDREWRADPAIAGGGEMLDQGVHLIDLARWFAGDFVEIKGWVGSYFWDMPVEDNGFAMLATRDHQVAWLHASCTEWRNLFSFEVFGRDGKLQVDGLGGSYGLERLTYYRMLPEMGPPETTIWEFPWEDRSWHHELEDFVACIEGHPSTSGSTLDALAALSIVGEIYRQAGRDYRS
jgi:predicted dehydrogenase